MVIRVIFLEQYILMMKQVITLPLEVKLAFENSTCCFFEADLSLVDQEKIKEAINNWSSKQQPIFHGTFDKKTKIMTLTSEHPKPFIPQAISLSHAFLATRLCNPLDTQLISEAKNKGKRIIFLESWEKQMSLMYGLQFDFQSHLDFFQYASARLKEDIKTFESLKEAYLKQNIEQIKITPPKSAPNIVHQFYQALIDDRDTTLAESIKGFLEQGKGGLFFAVGARHLPGIITKLESADCTMQAVPLSQRYYPISGSIEDGKKVEAFRKIYHALYAGQSNELKTKGLFPEPEMILSIVHIKDYVQKNPNSRYRQKLGD